jgi:hypothetical protein
LLENTDRILEPFLEKGESLLWSGKPKQGLVFRSSDYFLIPFSLMWGGFAIFWEIMALTFLSADSNAPAAIKVIFPLFGIPFVLIGLYMIIGRYWVDSKIRSNTTYGISDKQILISSGLFDQKLNSLPIQNLPNLEMIQKQDGSGSILFGQFTFFYGVNQGFPMPGHRRMQVPQFECIDNVAEIYRTVMDAQNRLTTVQKQST